MHRQRGRRPQPGKEALHRFIGPGEGVLHPQVLINALGGEPLLTMTSRKTPHLLRDAAAATAAAGPDDGKLSSPVPVVTLSPGMVHFELGTGSASSGRCLEPMVTSAPGVVHFEVTTSGALWVTADTHSTSLSLKYWLKLLVRMWTA